MNMFKPDTASSPEEYIRNIADEARREQMQTLHAFIRKTVPKLAPFMISGMIGYGKYHYKYPSGREGEWCTIALASQRNYISEYACANDGKQYVAEKYVSKLPKANIGKSCIRFKRIDEIDLNVLATILKEAENNPMGLAKS